jgi:hypothetical protein
MEHCEFSAGQALIVAFNLLQIRMPSFGAQWEHQGEMQWHSSMIHLTYNLDVAIFLGDYQIMLAFDG